MNGSLKFPAQKKSQPLRDEKYPRGNSADPDSQQSYIQWFGAARHQKFGIPLKKVEDGLGNRKTGKCEDL